MMFAIFKTRMSRLFRIEVVAVVFLAVVVATSGLTADGMALLTFTRAIWSDPQGAFRTWNSSDDSPCFWKGVTCGKIQGEDRVVSIDLSGKALGGIIAPSLGELEYLAEVNLGFNTLTGQIPRELFKATGLSHLYLSYNDLTGGIPAEIGNLGPQLRVLEISNNQLTELPETIVACYRLQRLVLGDNRIGGVIPVAMGTTLAQLERLDLSVNGLSGSIPDDFGNLTSLLPQAPLNLSNNRFTGAIPPSLAKLQTVPIDLSNNQLSGPIPSNSYFQSQGPVAYGGNAALCGSPLKIDCTPSPSPSPSSFVTAELGRNSTQTREPPLSKAAVVAISVCSGIAGFMLVASFVLYFLMSIRNSKNLSIQRADSASRCFCRPAGNGRDDQADLVHLSGVFSFNLEQLLRASAYILGKSDVGIVYKAVLDEGSVVAVRRLGEGGGQKRKEFESEVKSIAQVRHPNVISLHSYSWTPDEKLLVYDYLPNGSLEAALHGNSESGWKETLTCDERLRIACGAARGIAHIHERKRSHGDIKLGNILLDEFLEPRIAELGLQRLLSLEAQPVQRIKIAASATTRCDSERSASSVSPAPECEPWMWTSMSPHGASFSTGVMHQAPSDAAAVATTTRASRKSEDVYAFGVVLLELLTGRSQCKPIAAGQLDLVAWLRFALQQQHKPCEIFDPALLGSSHPNSQTKVMEALLQVALTCIAVNPNLRPKMKRVVGRLEQIHGDFVTLK